MSSSHLLIDGFKGRLAATDLVQRTLVLPVSSSCLYLGRDNVEASTLARAGKENTRYPASSYKFQ